MAEQNYIENIGDNRRLYRKSYFLEFYGEDGTTVEDAFSFSVPPESEELGYSQRKSETKTFGGLHVDDYGIDAVKIMLSGSTINQSLKMIYRGSKESKWLSGEEEIYYLRDLITKYKTGEENLKKKIMIYDLSKYSETNKAGNRVKNYWQAFPGDFKIRRSSDRPFTYKYSFEFTGISPDEGEEFKSHGKPPELNAEHLNILRAMMEALMEAVNFIDRINGLANNVLDKINQVSALLKILGNIMSYAANTIAGIVDSIGDAIVGLIDGAASIVDGANSIVSLPRTIQLKALNVGLEVQNASRDLMKSVDSLSRSCRDSFSQEYREIPKEVLDQYGMNNEEFKDSIIGMLKQAENTACRLSAASKSSDIPEVAVGNPDPETGAQRIILSYGDAPVMIKDTDTLESLAVKYLGDPNKAIDIATYNGAASLSDLSPGSIIKIPTTSRTQRMKRNLIFARREDRDNYGKDIMLSEDGRVIASNSGDYALADGTKNLSQAVLLRLRENVARRIRLNAYGIRTNISDPNAGVAYIISSIDLTVSRDPRVSSVDSIRFSGGGDSLNVDVDYSDINKSGMNITGRL
jgi:hypothetical protein